MVTLSLCMIVKNEEAVLARVLDAMKSAADEIIIVDTGSTDRTKEIAAQYTPLIFDYEWHSDFSAARNYAISKASMEYWMWLDADDVITPKQQKALLSLKNTLDTETDIVMMRYITGFDALGNPLFTYYRERLIKNGKGFLWDGKVHETIPLSGKIMYVPIEIEHRKEHPGDADRNLNIYETMLQNHEILTPRHQFYYGRELYYHNRYADAIKILKHFLHEPEGWIENKIDACLQLAHCYEQLEMKEDCLKALLNSFIYDAPRAEICCEIGRQLMLGQQFQQAVYWYQQALSIKPREFSGAFIQQDCYGFVPYIQLCMCYDRIGNYQEAYRYHLLSKSVKPDSDAVRYNQQYFESRHPEVTQLM